MQRLEPPPALDGVTLKKRGKALPKVLGSARMTIYTANFIRAVLVFAAPVPNLPVLRLPI